MSITSCYRLRRQPDARGFATAWDIAIQNASRRLADIAFDRAINGSEEPVYDPDGRHIGVRRRYNDRLLMFLLRAHQPERFRHATRDTRSPDEPPPRPALPVAEALAALAPPTPAEPHLLVDPDELASRLTVADICEGELPHWHRGAEPDLPPEPGRGPVRRRRHVYDYDEDE